MYTVIGPHVLLSAVWIGLNFANRLVDPIRRLIARGQRGVHRQPLMFRFRSESQGDIAQLGDHLQQNDPRVAHPTRRYDTGARTSSTADRRFTEAVLAGASAGVIGIDADSVDQYSQSLGRETDLCS